MTLLAILTSLLAFFVGLIAGYFLNAILAGKARGGIMLQQGDGDDGDDGGDPETERPTCTPDFLFNRQTDNFYRMRTRGAVNRKRACDEPFGLEVPERTSIPIYWAVVGTEWTENTARAKVTEAETWFARYCIILIAIPVSLRLHEAAAIQRELSAADGDSDDFANKASEMYEALWRRAGRPRDLLMILFLDAFREVRYGERVDRVAGNFEDFPLILIPGTPDRRSDHIVTHELIHGLGKRRNDSSRPPTNKSPNSDDGTNTWQEAACEEDMGNASRTNPAAPMVKPDFAMLDWASYYQFVERAESIS